MKFRRLLPLGALLGSLGPALTGVAQEQLVPPRGDRIVEQYLQRQVRELDQREFAGTDSPQLWEAIRPRLKRELFQMLGLWPLPERTPLQAERTGTLDAAGGVVIEKIHFQSRPGLYVTGNLYRPKEPAGRLPAILYLCGHSGRGRDGNKTAFQDHGMWFARHGYIAFLIDTLQLGELAGVHHGTYSMGRWWWQALGYTPAGVECWNGIRAIDYLIGRPDVDPDRIGVTGISGGGASTFWVAAADDRVACAVPVSGMSDLESYVSHKIINGHCDCMFMVNTYRWEWTTIAALVAPRPLLFANSDRDPIFPMDGNLRIIDRLRRFYAMLGHAERVAEHVSPGGHDYRPDLRMAVFSWINAHLKGDRGPVEDAADQPLEGRLLRVFPEDDDLPRDARNGRIDEEFVAPAAVELPDPWSFERWRAERLAELRALSFREFPARIPPARARSKEAAAGPVRVLETEVGIEVDVLDRRGDHAAGTPGTLLVLNEEESLEAVPAWALPIVGDGPVVVLAPRGIGATAWVRKSPPNYVERAHALVGRTVDAGRVWDAAAVLRWLSEEGVSGGTWRIAGSGAAGIIAAYAAILEPAASEVLIHQPPPSHRQGPIFLNVLRVIDVPTALGLLAPRPLRLIGTQDNTVFGPTRSLYQAAGAAAMLEIR
jgi:dienelactone hydrolase